MNRLNRKSTAAAIILWTFLFTMGCGATKANASPTAGGSRKAMSDKWISDAVEDELLFDQWVPAGRLSIKTVDGIVELMGRVDNLLAKDRAERVAETVRGVRSVVNRIQVDPFWGRSDLQIKQDAEEALIYDTATDSWEIDVDVTGGTATLTGEVDSWREKQLAATVVKGVMGVKDIKNDSVVRYDSDRTDYEIREDIEKTLQWDILVDNGLVDVEVDDGRVRLSGTVGSTAEKTQAAWDAWVAGVKEVDADMLEVKFWTRDPRLRKRKYVYRSDGEISEAVENAILYDPRVASLNVKADVSNGHVTLRGNVDSLDARRAAGKDARNTVGVQNVTNRLRIDISTATDVQLENRIARAFLRDPFIERFDIVVDVINGTAFLRGEVDTYSEKTRAENLASRVHGITGIKNNLDVEDDRLPLTYDPFLPGYDPYVYYWYDYRPFYSPYTDTMIRSAIIDELWWSPYVDSDDVKVTVVDGIATLSGEAGSRFERDKATEEAFEGGAVWVRNKLKIN